MVEDDHDLRQYLKNFLQDKFKIFEATNGQEGLLLAQKELPDLIVSDVMMPKLDGVSMCKMLKEDYKTSHIPTLMLTAKTDKESKNIGLEVGAWDYISKPFNTNDIKSKIENIINTRNSFKSYILNQNSTLEIKKHYTAFDQHLIAKIKKIILENITDTTFTVEVLSKEIGLSRMHLHRKLKALTGKSSLNFIHTIKTTIAADMFDQGIDRVQEVMDAVGISSYSHFNTIFKKKYGVTPSEYLKNVTLTQKK
ncbi:MAG: response regulator [Aureibaculum sp.]|nr:response regulator [Aureibaculum sp.]